MEQKTLLHRWQQNTGIYGIIGLWIPFFLFWIWMGLHMPVMDVFSGRVFHFMGSIFSSHFNYRAHAGSALDQPTIGKFLTWYTVFSCIAMVWAAFIHSASDIQISANRKVHKIMLLTVAFWAMCILLAPVCLLLQYIWSMGITSTRFFGIGYSFGSILAWIAFVYLLSKPTQERKSKTIPG